MIVLTGIMSHVKVSLEQWRKWNLRIFSAPYTLDSEFPNSSLKADTWSEDFYAYKFTTNANYISGQWKRHVIILASAAFGMLYQGLFEDKAILELFLHFYGFMCFSWSAVIAYIQHLQGPAFSSFLNQLLSFEKRRLDCSSLDERTYWKNLKYRKLIVATLHLLRISFQWINISYTISIAFMPESPWRVVPTVVYSGLQYCIINTCDPTGGILVDLSWRAMNCICLYVTLYVCCSHILDLVTLSFLTSQSSLCFMIVALKRFLSTDTRWEFTCESKLNTTVGMLREIQLLFLQYNRMHKRRVIPAVIILLVIDASVSLFVMVTSLGTLEVESMLIFGNEVAISLIIILLVTQGAAKSHTESTTLMKLQGATYNFNGKSIIFRRESGRGRAMARYWRSVPVFKIYFFETNFFEKETTCDNQLCPAVGR